MEPATFRLWFTPRAPAEIHKQSRLLGLIVGLRFRKTLRTVMVVEWGGLCPILTGVTNDLTRSVFEVK
jgi:hypothetical protein